MRGLLVSVVVLGSVSLVSCSQPAQASMSKSVIEVHRVQSYRSLAGLAADSNAVIMVTATNRQSVDYVGPTPFTVTVARVDKSLRGSISGGVVRIRQIGVPNGPTIVGAPPLLAPGQSYVAFLQRFTFGVGRETDQYVITGGGAGLFLRDGDGLTRLDRDSVQLPKRLTVLALEQGISPT